MKEKPITPYARLLERARQLAFDAKNPRRRLMWTYPKGRLSEGWQLSDLQERVGAADQLGYDVVLRKADDGLRVEYVKRLDVPMDLL